MKTFIYLFIIMVLLLPACEQNAQVSSSSTGLHPKRLKDPKALSLGENVYKQNCEQCHGVKAKGAASWRQVGLDGKYPAPPLDGSGHAWHHSVLVLTSLIRDGTQPQGNMPAWKGKLTDEQIAAVISYFQSLWPDPVYAAWYERQKNSN